jgi:hypothetical protein
MLVRPIDYWLNFVRRYGPFLFALLICHDCMVLAALDYDQRCGEFGIMMMKDIFYAWHNACF